MEIRAAVLRAPGHPLVVESLTLDPPSAGEVLVRIVASGLCRSDLSIAAGNGRVTPPLVLGHEGAGIVEAVGPAVTAVEPGDHVVLALVPACGVCFYCARGKPNLCEQTQGRFEGTMLDGTRRLHRDGVDVSHLTFLSTFADHAVVPARCCIKVRTDAPLDRICLIGCGVMTGVGAAINTASVEPGASVAVFGCGGVGLSIIQGAALAGARMIIGIDQVRVKLELAQRLGATHVMKATSDIVSRLTALTGRGADYAFEAIGNTAVMEQALAATRPGGTCTLVGLPGQDAVMAVNPTFLQRDRRLQGCSYGSARPWIDIPMLVDFYMDRRLGLDELITETRPLEEVNEAMDALRSGSVARTVLVT